MATITLLDDSTRPKAPKLEGATPRHQLPGRQLKMIHRHHLMQMADVRELLQQIEAEQSKQIRNTLQLTQALIQLIPHLLITSTEEGKRQKEVLIGFICRYSSTKLKSNFKS